MMPIRELRWKVQGSERHLKLFVIEALQFGSASGGFSS